MLDQKVRRHCSISQYESSYGKEECRYTNNKSTSSNASEVAFWQGSVPPRQGKSNCTCFKPFCAMAITIQSDIDVSICQELYQTRWSFHVERKTKRDWRKHEDAQQHVSLAHLGVR